MFDKNSDYVVLTVEQVSQSIPSKPLSYRICSIVSCKFSRSNASLAASSNVFWPRRSAASWRPWILRFDVLAVLDTIDAVRLRHPCGCCKDYRGGTGEGLVAG